MIDCHAYRALCYLHKIPNALVIMTYEYDEKMLMQNLE